MDLHPGKLGNLEDLGRSVTLDKACGIIPRTGQLTLPNQLGESMENSLTNKKIPRFRKKKMVKRLFIISMLAYPILHFLICWVYINSNSIYLTFTRYIWTEDKFMIYGPDPFINYRMWVTAIKSNPTTQKIITNSLKFFPVTCFISLPLSVTFSYFLFKKMPLSNIFRVIFYLPSILPVAVLTMSFRFAFGKYGFINPILESLFPHMTIPDWWGSYSITPRMIFAYCVWAGLGFNIVLFSGAMSRIPIDIIEYNRLEGVGLMRELVQIMVPLIWPTITTTFIIGMSSVLTLYQQPYFLMMSTSGAFDTNTIALYIFANYSNTLQVPQIASFGLLCSVVFTPLILFVRWLFGKFFTEVDF
jgi:multiple sugar transport system permease protein/N-acetylglucosamine transport system permease protein